MSNLLGPVDLEITPPTGNIAPAMRMRRALQRELSRYRMMRPGVENAVLLAAIADVMAPIRDSQQRTGDAERQLAASDLEMAEAALDALDHKIERAERQLRDIERNLNLRS